MLLRMMLVTMAMVIPILAVLAFPVAGLEKTLPLDDFRTLILVNEGINWKAGRNICKSNYTDLVTLYGKTDEEQLLKLAPPTSIPQILIGLKKGNSYIWSNGDPLVYNSHLLNDQDKCVTMKANRDWDPLNCTYKRAFICYSDVPDISSRYTLIRKEKNWTEALDYCKKKYTDLVSIKDEEQNKAVSAGRGNYSKNVWIGLKWDGWEWADGGMSGYRNWKSTPNVSEDNSVVINGEKWMASTETTNTALICYKDHIHISNVSMTWEESLDYCRGFDGSFCILSPKEQLAATRLMRRLQITEPVWVGLQQSSLLGLWVWTIGETLAWNNWKGGQVPQLPLSHHCGALTSEKEDFKWADMNCMTRQRALCYDWVVNTLNIAASSDSGP